LVAEQGLCSPDFLGVLEGGWFVRRGIECVELWVGDGPRDGVVWMCGCVAGCKAVQGVR
jgi:hypothetical protein